MKLYLKTLPIQFRTNPNYLPNLYKTPWYDWHLLHHSSTTFFVHYIGPSHSSFNTLSSFLPSHKNFCIYCCLYLKSTSPNFPRTFSSQHSGFHLNITSSEIASLPAPCKILIPFTHPLIWLNFCSTYYQNYIIYLIVCMLILSSSIYIISSMKVGTLLSAIPLNLGLFPSW